MRADAERFHTVEKLNCAHVHVTSREKAGFARDNVNRILKSKVL